MQERRISKYLLHGRVGIRYNYAQEEIVTGLGSEYGKSGYKRLKSEGT